MSKYEREVFQEKTKLQEKKKNPSVPLGSEAYSIYMLIASKSKATPVIPEG